MSKRKHLCPFCFSGFDKIPYLCCNARCKSENENRLLYPKSGLFKTPNNVKCPECGYLSYKSVCPNCFQEYDNIEPKFIVPILGNRASGKSTYYGVLIHEMIKRIAPSYKGSFEGFGDSYRRYICDFQNNLYNGIPVCVTPPINYRTRYPMVFNYKWSYSRNRVCSKLPFVIHDCSSEDILLTDADLKDIEYFNNRLFSNASGILLIIDPLSFKDVVEQVEIKTNFDRHIVDRYDNDYSDYMLSNITKLIRKTNRFEEHKKIEIPVAVVLSKYDIFDNLVPEDYIAKLPSPHCKLGGFDDNDRRVVNDEIALLLDKWGAYSITAQLENNYKTYSYFAVSSLGIGNSPKYNGTFDIPHPHRIEDPILWLMKENKIIK